MSQKLFDELGSLQRAVMDVLWEKDEATVAQMRELLGGTKKPAYTTVLTVLQKLEKAGWAKHRADGRTYIYSTKRSRETEGTKSLKGYLDRVFQGNPLLLFEHLMDDERIDSQTLDTLKKMIDNKHKERSNHA